MVRPERFELPTSWFVGWRSLTCKYMTNQGIAVDEVLNIFGSYARVTH